MKSLGPLSNRECVTCTPPCQGGEVLHKRGYCCHSYCACVAFTLKGSKLEPLDEVLHPQHRIRKPAREPLQ